MLLLWHRHQPFQPFLAARPSSEPTSGQPQGLCTVFCIPPPPLSLPLQATPRLRSDWAPPQAYLSSLEPWIVAAQTPTSWQAPPDEESSCLAQHCIPVTGVHLALDAQRWWEGREPRVPWSACPSPRSSHCPLVLGVQTPRGDSAVVSVSSLGLRHSILSPPGVSAIWGRVRFKGGADHRLLQLQGE